MSKNKEYTEFRVAVLVLYSLRGRPLPTLLTFCSPNLSPRSTHQFHSADQGFLHVPIACASTTQSRAFSVVGPLVWKGLSLALRSLPRVFSQKFHQQLKTTLFSRTGVGSTSE